MMDFARADTNTPGRIGRRRPRLVALATVAVATIAVTGLVHVGPAGAATLYPITATIAVGTSPDDVAIDSGAHTAYVLNEGYVNQNSDDVGNSVSVIDETTGAVTSTIGVGQNPLGVAVDPGTHSVYVANQTDNNVSVIDGTTGAVSTIGVGMAPIGVAIDPGNHTVYVPNLYSNTVSVINGTTNRLTATYRVGSYPDAVAVDPNTHTLYVANSGDSTVSMIDGTTKRKTTVGVGAGAASVAVDPGTHTVYVANYDDNTVSVIDGTTGAVSTIGVGTNPSDVAIDPGTHTVYVVNRNGDNLNIGNTVSVIDENTATVVATVAISDPSAAAVDPGTHAVYVTNQGDNTVSVITPTSSQSQTINFTSTAPDPGRVGDFYTVTATGGGSGKQVTFTTDAGSAGCTVVDNGNSTATVAFTDPGTCLIDANQAGSDDQLFDPAPQVQQKVTVADPIPVVPAATVTGLQNTSGPVDGGRTVTITGTSFIGVTGVDFGAAAATSFTVNSPTNISAVTPATSTAGPVHVTVTTAVGTSDTTASDVYKYYLRPVVSSITPASGPQSGGTTITIKGRNFTKDAMAFFGSDKAPATSLTFKSSTTLTCVTPAHAKGRVHVYVGNQGGQSSFTGTVNGYQFN